MLSDTSLTGQPDTSALGGAVGVSDTPSASLPPYQSGLGLGARQAFGRGRRAERERVANRRFRPVFGSGYLDILPQYEESSGNAALQGIRRCAEGHAPPHLGSANFWAVEENSETGEMRARPLSCGDRCYCPRCAPARARQQAAKMALMFDGIYDGARALGLPVDHRMSGIWFTITKEDSAALHALSDPPDGYYGDQAEDSNARRRLDFEFERRRKRYRRALAAMQKAAQAAALAVLPDGVQPGGLSIIHTHGSEDPLTPHYHVIVLLAPVAFDKASGRCRALSRWRSTKDREQLRVEWTAGFNRVMRETFGRDAGGDLLNVRVGYHQSQGQARHTLNYELRAPLKDLMQGLTRPGVYEWRDKSKRSHMRELDDADVVQFLTEFKDRRLRLNRFRQWGFLAPNVKGERLTVLGFQRVEDGDQSDVGEWVGLGTFSLGYSDTECGVAVMRRYDRVLEIPLAAFFADNPVGVGAGHSLWQRVPDG